MTAPDGEYRRWSGRVLLLDGDGRVLLFRCHLDPADPTAGDIWMAPGGGLEDGESSAQAAARELHEETGVAVTADDLGDTVAVASGFANLGWASGVFRDDFFVHRVADPTIDTSALREGPERDSFVEFRWWTVADLETTTENVIPLRLAGLLATLAAGGVPAHPVRLPWHH